MEFFARGFFKNLAEVDDETFDAPLALTYIDFANFHRLDDCGEHNVLSAKDAFANEGKVLSDVTSFAYDGLSEEQIGIALNYDITTDQIREACARPLSDYMVKLQNYFQAKQNVQSAIGK